MRKLSAIFIFLITVMILTTACGNSSPISSKEMKARDGSIISAEERESIRALVPYFKAVVSKDVPTVKGLYPFLKNAPEDRLLAVLNLYKFYVLRGVENTSFDGTKLKTSVIFDFEVITPGPAREISIAIADVELVKENQTWTIASWKTSDRKDMAYFTEMADKRILAEKRYGVDDLTTWEGL